MPYDFDGLPDKSPPVIVTLPATIRARADAFAAAGSLRHCRLAHQILAGLALARSSLVRAALAEIRRAQAEYLVAARECRGLEELALAALGSGVHRVEVAGGLELDLGEAYGAVVGGGGSER